MRILPSLLFALAAIPSIANAHIALISPPPRYTDLKAGPCGKGASDARTGTVTKFKPGAAIDVTWKETIGHPGHFRIAFDPNGTGLFKDPTSFTDVAMGPGILVNNIADKTGTQTYTQRVTLPNVECTNCTLQVMQIMTDKPPFGDGNDLYYQCADIILAKDAPDDAGIVATTDAGGSSSSGGGVEVDSGSGNPDGGGATPATEATPGTDGGCNVGGSSASSAAMAGLVGALAVVLAARRPRTKRPQT